MNLTLLILKIKTNIEDVQMILKWYFNFSTGFKFSNFQRSVWSVPSISLHNTTVSLKAIYFFDKVKLILYPSPEFFTTGINIPNVFENFWTCLLLYSSRLYLSNKYCRICYFCLNRDNLQGENSGICENTQMELKYNQWFSKSVS